MSNLSTPVSSEYKDLATIDKDFFDFGLNFHYPNYFSIQFFILNLQADENISESSDEGEDSKLEAEESDKSDEESSEMTPDEIDNEEEDEDEEEDGEDDEEEEEEEVNDDEDEDDDGDEGDESEDDQYSDDERPQPRLTRSKAAAGRSDCDVKNSGIQGITDVAFFLFRFYN